MLEEFGIEFPEVAKPIEDEDVNSDVDNNGEDLPFGED